MIVQGAFFNLLNLILIGGKGESENKVEHETPFKTSI